MELGLGANWLGGPLVRWFSAPVLQTPERTRQARSLWMVAWPFLGVVAGVLALAVAVEPSTLVRRAVTIADVAILVAILHEINRRGRPVLASWMLVIGLVLIVTQRAWNTGGIHAPVAVFYTLFIVLAGRLLGTRAALITALVCLAGGVFLTGAEMGGWLHVTSARPPVSSLVFLMLTLGLTLVVQKVLMPPAALPERAEGVPSIVRQMHAPIMDTLGHLGRVRREATGPIVGDVDEAIKSARAVSHLANSLLDGGRPAPAQPLLEPTDVVAVARSVVFTLAASHPDRHIVVRAGSPVISRSAPALVQLVLEHLVGNGIQHSAGRVQVHIQPATLAGGVRIEVHDEGPGIPDEWRLRMLGKPGAASPRSPSDNHGTGMGLELCKLSVEAAGGTIRIDAAEPRGSAVVVTLPA